MHFLYARILPRSSFRTIVEARWAGVVGKDMITKPTSVWKLCPQESKQY